MVLRTLIESIDMERQTMMSTINTKLNLKGWILRHKASGSCVCPKCQAVLKRHSEQPDAPSTPPDQLTMKQHVKFGKHVTFDKYVYVYTFQNTDTSFH
jgi:hypothetical protein